MSNPYFIQMAHYALGKKEIELGHQLGWRERSEFIKEYVAQETKLSEKKDDE
jgi:hypothetical protein